MNHVLVWIACLGVAFICSVIVAKRADKCCHDIASEFSQSVDMRMKAVSRVIAMEHSIQVVVTIIAIAIAAQYSITN